MVIHLYTEQPMPARLRIHSTKAETQAHSRNQHGSTPLLLAAETGHTYLVKLLLAKNDVNVSAIDNGKDKPMMCVEPG